MQKDCLYCGKTIFKTKTKSIKEWNTSVKYCSLECSGHATSKERIIALNKSRTGKPFSMEHRNKMKIKRMGRKPNLGKHHTEETKRQLSISIKKGNTPEVRKQKSLSHLKIYKDLGLKNNRDIVLLVRGSFKYRQWRSDVFERDLFTCQDCGDKGIIRPHHIDRLTDILRRNNITTLEDSYQCEEVWNLNNGITVCIPCHKIRHKNIYKNL